MKLVAVTACPTGVAHTVMAAEALKRQAEVMGHTIEVETQGADGIRHPLSPEAIDAADAVIVAADIYIDPARFAGKPMHATSTAQAIRHTEQVVRDAIEGSVGAKNVLMPEELAEADAVVIAAGAKVDLSRFGGKRIYETGTK